jgi:hypothetical protein
MEAFHRLAINGAANKINAFGASWELAEKKGLVNTQDAFVHYCH